MIAAPEGGAQTHLDALAKLSGILMDDKVRKIYYRLIQKEEILRIIDDADDEATKEEEKKLKNKAEAQATTGASANDNANEPYVLAVTACPTGIAHTYMARDALKNKQKNGS